MHHIFGGEITMKFEIVELIGHKAFVICVQDFYDPNKEKKVYNDMYNWWVKDASCKKYDN